MERAGLALDVEPAVPVDESLRMRLQRAVAQVHLAQQSSQHLSGDGDDVVLDRPEVVQLPLLLRSQRLVDAAEAIGGGELVADLMRISLGQNVVIGGGDET